MNNQETTEIITELETKIAFLEAANDDLEQALLSQDERIDRLDVIVNELRNRVKEQASLIEGLASVSSQPPPLITKTNNNNKIHVYHEINSNIARGASCRRRTLYSYTEFSADTAEPSSVYG